jgi:hypothetical protein
MERVPASIGEIERDFDVSQLVEVVCKPKGFDRWCTLPYPRYPHGCPNFGKKTECPPFAPYFLDVYEPLVKIARLKFNFGEYLNFRRSVHPGWAETALKNSRHFQEHLDSELRKGIAGWKSEFAEDWVVVYSPEAMSVNIHLTCKNAGIDLEWPPRETMYRIAFLAQPLRSESKMS